MAGLPLLKLSGLLIKTIAKPVATRLKIESVKHPRFQHACKSVGQFSHQITSRLNVFAAGYRFVGVKPLEDDAALTKGINFFSESFVFLVAGSIIIIEYNKSEEKSAETKKKAAAEKAAEKADLEKRFGDIEFKITEIENRLNDIGKILPEETQELIRIRQELRKDGKSELEIDVSSSESQQYQLATIKLNKKDRNSAPQPPPPPSSGSLWYKLWTVVGDKIK